MRDGKGKASASGLWRRPLIRLGIQPASRNHGVSIATATEFKISACMHTLMQFAQFRNTRGEYTTNSDHKRGSPPVVGVGVGLGVGADVGEGVSPARAVLRE